MSETNGTLVLKTRELLMTDRRSSFAISLATGIQVDWIRQFRINRFPNPGVNRVQRLYEFLAGRKLEV